MPRGQRFPGQARVRSSGRIRHLVRHGRRFESGPLELFAAPSPAGRPRVAAVVPRHGRTVVDRNRLRRRIQEVLRREWLPGAVEAGPDVDLVVRARPSAYELSFDELRSRLLRGLESLESTAWPDGSSSR